jgi:hypothetical protein
MVSATRLYVRGHPDGNGREYAQVVRLQDGSAFVKYGRDTRSGDAIIFEFFTHALGDVQRWRRVGGWRPFRKLRAGGGRG